MQDARPQCDLCGLRTADLWTWYGDDRPICYLCLEALVTTQIETIPDYEELGYGD